MQLYDFKYKKKHWQCAQYKFTHGPLDTGFRLLCWWLWCSRCYTPLPTHSLPASLLVRWFSGWSGELRCISTETEASGRTGNQPDYYGRSYILLHRNIHSSHISDDNQPQKKKPLRKWTVYVHLDFLVPKRRMKLKIWLLRFAACRGDTSIGHTIYISCAERRIAPWSQRAFHNRPRRHHPAPDCVDFVCVYVQLKTHPIASITSAIWHTSVSLFRL